MLLPPFPKHSTGCVVVPSAIPLHNTIDCKPPIYDNTNAHTFHGRYQLLYIPPLMATTALSCSLDLKSAYPKRVPSSLLSLSVSQPLVPSDIINGAGGPSSVHSNWSPSDGTSTFTNWYSLDHASTVPHDLVNVIKTSNWHQHRFDNLWAQLAHSSLHTSSLKTSSTVHSCTYWPDPSGSKSSLLILLAK